MRIRNLAARGFTLVELLTVIAIIALLVGILVPAIGAVRTRAKVTATRATISSLETGIEAFRGDQTLGGAYPPSASDYKQGNNLTYNVQNAYRQINIPPQRVRLGMSGAGLLVWALAGADLLGTAGFRPFRSSSSFWAEDTDYEVGNYGDTAGAYAIEDRASKTPRPLRPRVGPFIDTSKIKISRWIDEADVIGGPGSFEIPAETETLTKIGARPVQRQYPMFLDSFGRPFLYWRADSAGEQCADTSPNDLLTSPDKRGRYHFRDNAYLLEGQGVLATSLTIDPRDTLRDQHPLVFSQTNQSPTTIPTPSSITPQSYTFATYLRNKAVTARIEPQKADSYIIVSAGEDGLFGTDDDIANFDHNGAEVPR